MEFFWTGGIRLANEVKTVTGAAIMIFFINKRMYIFFIFIFCNILCDKGEKINKMETIPNLISEIKNSEWERLAKKRIFFGHMSVGYNIIDGLNDIIKENPEIKLNIIETNDIAAIKVQAFSHSRIGKNTEPAAKIDMFENLMDQGMGNNVDIAFFKLCYVDISQDTDIENLFIYYKTAMNKLIQKYSKTKFIHVTVPLTSENLDRSLLTILKDIVKSGLGKITTKERNIAANIKRNELNQLIRNEYPENKIFDLAKIESIYPDGTRESFLKDNTEYFTLIPEFTNDGGHLNEIGRKVMARNLLVFLTDL